MLFFFFLLAVPDLSGSTRALRCCLRDLLSGMRDLVP